MEAALLQEGCSIDYTPDAAVSGGEVVQLKDGRAAVLPVDLASGIKGAGSVEGIFKLQKTASIAILNGGRVYWDHSANKAHYKKVNDRDFYVGRAVADSDESSTTVNVAFNIDPPYDIDLLRDAALSVPVGTQVVGAFGFPKVLGGALSLELTATNEAQKVDLLSVDGFAKAANAIAEFIFRIPDDGAGTAADLSIGVANGTHATDADSITEAVFAHLDANATAIKLESDDGTTEVNATDSTKTYSEGSAVANRTEVWIDMRDPADVQIYINGVLCLADTVFNVDAATGPFFLLAHLEKTSSTDVYRAVLDAARVRLGQQ